jgi:hypothetical protein
MKKIAISLLLFLLIHSFSNSQSFVKISDFKNNYTPLKVSGTIPDDLCNLFTEAYTSEKDNLDKIKSSRSERKIKEKFLRESNYYLNQILMSGIVLYNTPINEYVDKIMDKILISEPELRKNIRIYILKTPTVNASATDKGIMFVNLGLIAQSGSESQLAYILSHELIHYIKKHNIDLYLEKDKIVRDDNGLKSNSTKGALYKTHFRSREMENESDENGFNDYYLKTNYDLNQALETYDVLQYAYLPFDEIAFDKTFLTDSMFSFPEKYFPEAINPIKARDDYDDENSTHPNLKKRREALQERLEKQNNNNRIINPSGNDNFKAIRDMARFECLRLFVIEQNFTQSFYNAWIMKKEYPDNLFIDKILSASLYGLSKYKSFGSIGDVIPNLKKSEGEIHAVSSIFKNIKSNELNALAIRYIFKASQKHPNDNYLNEIKEDMFKDLVVKHKASFKDFINQSQLIIKTEVTEEKTDSIQKQSSKIRNIEKKKKSQKEADFYNYIFAGLLNNKAFSNNFDKAIKDAEEVKATKKKIKKSEKIKNKNKDEEDDEDEDEQLTDNDTEESDEEMITSGYLQRRGFKLGIDKILLYNPFYIKFDFRKKEQLRYFDTEKSQLEYIALLENNAKRVGLEMDIVVTTDFKTKGSDLYNKHLLLNDWTDEFTNWETSGNKIFFLSQDIKSIISEHNTNYLNITGIISAKASQIDNRVFSYLLYSAASPVTWPLTMQYFFRPAFRTMYYNLVVDMETGKKVFINTSTIEMSDSKAFLNSRVYDTFNQIKTKDK